MNVHKFEEKVADYVKKHHLLSSDEHIIVAVSGGADSVALLYVLRALNINCYALHCNFGLRGAESDRDEVFVRELCSSLDVPLKVRSFNVHDYERTYKVSTEMACRELRYAWFEDERVGQGATAIAVAHHHDDNVETFFLNMLRGSGINGLAGIKPRNGYIVRPLLCVARKEIEEYLKAYNQDYMVDSTNLENDFKRNKIRNELIPYIRTLFPNFETGIARTLSNLQGCNDLYEKSVCELRDKYISFGLKTSKIDLSFFDKMNEEAVATALYVLLKYFNFNSDQARNVYEACLGEAEGKRFLSVSHEAVISRGKIELFSLGEAVSHKFIEYIDLAKMIEIPKEDSLVTVTREIMGRSERGGIKGIDGKTSIALSERILDDYPVLTLRPWLKGDRIKPYGMKGTKLVSDLFVDAKYSEMQKRNTWLLCAGDEVLWVLGLRASSKYSVNLTDNSYLKLSQKK